MRIEYDDEGNEYLIATAPYDFGPACGEPVVAYRYKPGVCIVYMKAARLGGRNPELYRLYADDHLLPWAIKVMVCKAELGDWWKRIKGKGR